MSEAATSTVKTESAGSPPAAEPVVISGGDSPASWDELDALTATPKERKESKPKKEVKESKEASSKESEESFEEAESKPKRKGQKDMKIKSMYRIEEAAAEKKSNRYAIKAVHVAKVDGSAKRSEERRVGKECRL